MNFKYVFCEIIWYTLNCVQSSRVLLGYQVKLFFRKSQRHQEWGVLSIRSIITQK